MTGKEGIKSYRYYMLMRPFGPGAQPSGARWLKDLDGHTVIPSVQHHAWSLIEYDRPLTEKEIRDYELAICSDDINL